MNNFNKLQVDSTNIGLGCSYITAGSILMTDKRLIRAAYHEGVKHFDVAPQYGIGTAEKVLGHSLKGIRNDCTITTKVGIPRPHISQKKLFVRGLVEPIRPLLRKSSAHMIKNFIPKKDKLNFEKNYINKSLEESLKFLQTEYIDIFLLHMPTTYDINEELILLLEGLKSQGKVKYIGTATSREQSIMIHNKHKSFFDVCQYPHTVLDENIDINNDIFKINYGSILRSEKPLKKWLIQNPEICHTISKKVDMDISLKSNLIKCIQGASIYLNLNGINLIASRSIKRTKSNIKFLTSNEAIVIGKAFVDQLKNYECLPKPTKI